jgi:hypothetical protein
MRQLFFEKYLFLLFAVAWKKYFRRDNGYANCKIQGLKILRK